MGGRFRSESPADLPRIQWPVSSEYAIACALRDLNRHEEAETAFTGILRRNPDWFEAWKESAELARRRKNGELALQRYRHASRLSPGNVRIKICIAAELRQLGHPAEAEDVIHPLLLDQSGRHDVWMEAALIARQGGRAEDALQRFARAHALKPEDAPTGLDLAIELRDTGRYQEAEAIFAGLLKKKPDYYDALLGAARLYRVQGQHQAALERFKAANALHRKRVLDADICAELRNLGRLEEAEQVALNSTSMSPGQKWHQRGQIAVFRDDDSAAMACYRGGIGEEPSHRDCHTALYGVQARLGLIPEALQTLEHASRHIADPLSFRIEKLRLLGRMGLLDEARQQATALFETNRDHHGLCSLLIRWAVQLADFAEAEALIGRLPVSSLAQRRNLASLKATVSRALYDFESAQEHFERCLLFSPHDLGALLQLALLLIAQGRLRQADVCLKRVRGLKQEHGAARVRATAGAGLQFNLLLELRTNPFIQPLLEASFRLPLSEQPQAISRLLEEEPGYAGTALRLMFVLRRLGALSRSKSGDGSAVIPKTIVQFWDQSDVPEDIAQAMESWPRHCPGFEHHVFNDQTAADFLRRECAPEVLRAFLGASHPAMRSDLFRLAYLAIKGGIYADADDLCRHSIEPWLVAGCELLLLQEDIGSVGNNFIAATPGHPLILKVLEAVTGNLLHRQGGSTWFASGPGLLTLTFCSFYRETLARAELPIGIHFIDAYHATRCVSMHTPRQYKQTDRHWVSAKNNGKRQFGAGRNLAIRRTAEGFLVDLLDQD